MTSPEPGPRLPVSDRWRAWRASVDLEEYDRRWDRLAEGGHEVHGEADAVSRLGARSVLDGGCGTGRVGIELVRRGMDVIGVDNDPDMLERARRRAPEVRWVLGDLAAIDLGVQVELAVLAGNVLVFVRPGTEPAVVANVARHLVIGGLLVTGFQLAAGPRTAEAYEGWCATAGLQPVARWSTWDGAPYDGGRYGVFVHRRGDPADDPLPPSVV